METETCNVEKILRAMVIFWEHDIKSTFVKNYSELYQEMRKSSRQYIIK